MEKAKDNKKIEREYTIPLRARWSIVPRYKRTNKAVRTVKEFLVRHMKIRDRDLDKIRIDRYLNELLWARGIKNPPARVRVKAVKEGDIVRVYIAEPTGNIKFKQIKEEKADKSAKEISKKKTKKVAEELGSEQVQASPPSKSRTKENVDKNNDGVDDKKEVEEKKEATVEAGKEMEKVEAKIEKHTTKVQTPKQEKNQRTGYNQSGRGH